ncbi:MAG: 50S ribosomal protein L32 [Anaerolineae bacterium]|nr:50S ribosomal protein L32 [Anaerolineae bacterium]
MPAVPKRRTPSSRGDRRTASNYRSPAVPTLLACEKCGELVKPYHVCPHCGHYRGRQVIQTDES